MRYIDIDATFFKYRLNITVVVIGRNVELGTIYINLQSAWSINIEWMFLVCSNFKIGFSSQIYVTTIGCKLGGIA